MYIYTLFHHTELRSVLPHRWPSFTTLEKPTIWMVTYLSPSHTPICTHIHKNTLFVLQIVHHHTSIFTCLYTLFRHTELSICFTAQIAHHHAYIHIYILFHHTELTSVLPHRWPSFTTLGKPTIWMVTYISPSNTPTCTHIHTNILFVLQITHHHIYIYIYTMFHHTELSICFTAQIAHHHAYIYIYALFHHTELTSVLPHSWPSFTTLEKPTIWMVTYLSPSYTPICTHIHTVCFTDSPSYIHIYTYTYIFCFTTQS